MTDVFFSYSSKDRERVRPVRNALAAQGFEVFWDQEVPAGVDWDTWIRQHLQRAKCAVVFWSKDSIVSDNVRHEATVAKTQGKLVPVLLEHLQPEQFPMGLYSTQGVFLAAWAGDTEGTEWQKLQAQVEARLTPLWVARRLHNSEAAVLAESARREAAESRIRALQERLVKEAQAQQEAERGREDAVKEGEKLRGALAAAEGAAARFEGRLAGLERDLGAGRSELADSQQALSDTSARVAASERERDEARAEADGLGRQLARSREQASAAEDARQTLEQELRGIRAEAEKAFKQVDLATRGYSQVSAALAEMTRHRDAASSEASGLRAQLQQEASTRRLVASQLAAIQNNTSTQDRTIEQLTQAEKVLKQELQTAKEATERVSSSSYLSTSFFLSGAGLVAAAVACRPDWIAPWSRALTDQLRTLSPSLADSATPMLIACAAWLALFALEKSERASSFVGFFFWIVLPTVAVLLVRDFWPIEQWPLWGYVALTILNLAQIGFGLLAMLLSPLVRS